MSDRSGLNRLASHARSCRGRWGGRVTVLLAAGGLGLAAVSADVAAADKIAFEMIVSAGAAACLPDASAHVKVIKKKGAELMEIKVRGLPPNTPFNVFVIQKPGGPFGMSWYQGDITTNHEGKGEGKFLGRFNNETFIVAPGSVPAPQVHTSPPFPDALTNPITAPVHMYHVGMWFDSPDDAAAAGCPPTVTPFNGDHDAGIQVLNTGTFPDLAGPLSQLD